jgi:hypothetical protein
MANRPEKVFKCQNVSCAVWPPGKGPRTAEVTVSYKSGNEWKHTTKLGPKDVIVAARLLKMAGEYMIDKEAERSSSARRERTTARTENTKGDDADGGSDDDRPF